MPKNSKKSSKKVKIKEIKKDIKISELEKDVEEKQTGEEIDSEEFTEFLHPDSGTTSLDQVAIADEDEAFITLEQGVASAPSSTASNSKNDFKYDVANEEEEGPKYIPETGPSRTKSIDTTQLKREQLSPARLNQKVDFVHSIPQEEKPPQEKYDPASNVDTAQLGKENPFEKKFEDAKPVGHEPPT